MLVDMSLGTGIGVGSLFLALGTVAVVWINNIYKSCDGKRPVISSDGGSKNSGAYAQNGYVRKGEHDESIRSLHQRLDDTHKENKGWWKQLNEKVDGIRDELKESMIEQRKMNEGLNYRVTQIETTQKMCKKDRLDQNPEK